MSTEQIAVPPTEPATTAAAAPPVPERKKPGPKPGTKRSPAVSAAKAPQQAAAAKPLAIVTPGTNSRTGASLVPDLSRSSLGAVGSYWYWIGVIPGCPSEWIDVAGENFPKVNEDLVPNRMKPDEKIRIPRIGALVKLTREKFDRMCEILPRTVIRFTDDKGVREETGTGENLGDLHIRPRRGFLITIPTKQEEADRIANGLPSRAYHPSPKDEPAAKYMFAVLCTNQRDGNRGEEYPPTIAEMGLEWPDEV